MPALQDALREAGASFETALTSGPRDATRIVRQAIRDGYAGVAVVGGDGTLNEAVNGFFDEGGEPIGNDAWLGPLPCGTGGDFRRTLGVSNEVVPMVTRMMWAKPRAVDVGWLTYRDREGREGHRAFINIASFGMGGLVDDLVSRGPKWLGGKPAYLLGIVRAMGRYKNRAVRIVVDDQPPVELTIVNLAVANGRYFGGGLQIAPEAIVDDGLFDVVAIRDLSIPAQWKLAPALYGGNVLGRDGIWSARGKKVVAEPADYAGPVLLDVDGEALGALPATFELRPGAVRLRA